MKKLLEKIASNYYIAMAKRGKKYQKIIVRGKKEEIELLFHNIPNNQKEVASKLLYTTWLNSNELRPMVIEALFEYGSQEEIKEVIKTLSPFEAIIARGKKEEIKLLFQNMPNDQKEEASKLLYKEWFHDYSLQWTIENIIFQYGSQEDIIAMIRRAAPWEEVIARGKKEEIICCIKAIETLSSVKTVREYVKAREDKDIISACLYNSLIVDEDIIKSAISLKLYNALLENIDREEIAENVLNYGDKDLIFAAIPQLSSVGIDRVRKMESKLKLTKEEMSNLDTLFYKKQKSEEGWRMVSEIFDAAR